MSLPGDRPDLLVARVVPDVTGLDKEFDYEVPDALRDRVRAGSQVRVPLHGRRVGGWVVAVGPPDGSVAPDRLVPITKWSGIGPPAPVIELGRWAARRWGTNRLRPFMVAASPPAMVASLPAPVRRRRAPTSSVASGVHRLPPNNDPLPLVRTVAEAGPLLVVHPSLPAGRALARRLRAEGFTVAVVPDEWARAAAGTDVVVGARAAVWAPCPELASIMVLDEHDEALQEERTPTWHARDVAVERARRAGIACVLVSPAPSVAALAWAGAAVHRPSVADERASWPLLQVVDRTREEPWKRSLVTSELIAHLRNRDTRVVCVLNIVGRARLLACRACRSLQRCERCAAAVGQDDAGRLVCARCATVRPAVCQQCGSGALANVKPGVSRAREELEAAANRPVVAVTGESGDLPPADVHVGTEAVLHRVRNADVVAFLDLDAELLAPRYRAAEQAMALLVRAARLVGPRAGGGRVLVQTFVPDHEVLQSVLRADPTRLSRAEAEQRRALGLPPFRALAAVQGAGAAEFAAATGLESSAAGDVVLLRDDSWDALGAALAKTPRPKGSRLRVEVDPPRR